MSRWTQTRDFGIVETNYYRYVNSESTFTLVESGFSADDDIYPVGFKSYPVQPETMSVELENTHLTGLFHHAGPSSADHEDHRRIDYVSRVPCRSRHRLSENTRLS